jgi:hypothetical protein
MQILTPDKPPRSPGILFAEDFDDAPPLGGTDRGTPGEGAAEPEVAAPAFTDEDMAGARREGFAAGQRAAREEAAMRLQEAARQSCERLGEWLPRLDAMRETQLADAAEAAAKLIFAALAATLPSLSARHASSEIAHLLRDTFFHLAPDQALTLGVAPETIEPLRAALASLPRDLARRTVLSVDESLSPGDARLAWEGGTATRQNRLAQKAVADILASLDLLPPAPPHLAPPAAIPAQFAPQNVENVNV